MIRLYLKPSRLKGAGKGVFTHDLVSKDELIAEYIGEKKSRSEVVDNGFIFEIKQDLFLDPKCVIMYANDALGPIRVRGLDNNAYWHTIGERVFVLAERDIHPHEEILIGYGSKYWTTPEKKGNNGNWRLHVSLHHPREKRCKEQERQNKSNLFVPLSSLILLWCWSLWVVLPYFSRSHSSTPFVFSRIFFETCQPNPSNGRARQNLILLVHHPLSFRNFIQKRPAPPPRTRTVHTLGKSFLLQIEPLLRVVFRLQKPCLKEANACMLSNWPKLKGDVSKWC